MDARRVSYFLAVVDHGCISRAAAALGIAQPSLSQSLRALERELGARLFHRVSRGMVLTPAGNALIGPARQLLRDLAVARDAVGRHVGRVSGTLDIVTTPALSADPVAALVGAFRGSQPQVTVRVDDPVDDETLYTMVREAHSEVGISYLPAPDSGLEAHQLGVHEMWAAFPPGTRLEAPDPLPLAELDGAEIVGVPRGSSGRDLIEAAFRRAGVRTRLVVEVAQREATVPLVLAGAGVGFLPRSAAERAAARGAVVRPLDPPLEQPYGLVRRSGSLSPAATAFTAFALAWSARPGAGRRRAATIRAAG